MDNFVVSAVPPFGRADRLHEPFERSFPRSEFRPAGNGQADAEVRPQGADKSPKKFSHLMHLFGAVLFVVLKFTEMKAMRESEAATFLNIHTQTLYRYRKSGKLAFREVRSATRPVIEYDEADIKKLKNELDNRRESRSKPAPIAPPTSKRVTFGMPLEGYEELLQEAEQYGMSPGEYARRLVREGLESRLQAEAGELRAEVKRLEKELKTTRRDFAAGFEAVLEYVGLSPEDAKEWVAENLR